VFLGPMELVSDGTYFTPPDPGLEALEARFRRIYDLPVAKRAPCLAYHRVRSGPKGVQPTLRKGAKV